MKNLIKFLPIAAIVLGSGLAFATTSVVSTPNVFWNGSSWQSIVTPYECLEDEQYCVAYMDSNGNLSNHIKGYYVARP